MTEKFYTYFVNINTFMRILKSTELRTNLQEALAYVAGGEEVVLTLYNKEVAKLVPVKKATKNNRSLIKLVNSPEFQNLKVSEESRTSTPKTLRLITKNRHDKYAR